MRIAILAGFALLAACAPERPALTGKPFTVLAKAERSYGICQVRVGDRAYRLNDDLRTLRADMRARYGERMHLWSTEVRVDALNFKKNDCGALAVDGLHRAGFVKFTLVPADRLAAVATPPIPKALPDARGAADK